MKLGYYCEECRVGIWPATTPSELRWLRERRHIVREVASHLNNGLDSWMSEALAFLDEHGDHDVTYAEK